MYLQLFHLASHQLGTKVRGKDVFESVPARTHSHLSDLLNRLIPTLVNYINLSNICML